MTKTTERRWPAHLTTEQINAQLKWEADCKRRGTKAPWPGATWNGYNWEGGNPLLKWED